MGWFSKTKKEAAPPPPPPSDPSDEPSFSKALSSWAGTTLNAVQVPVSLPSLDTFQEYTSQIPNPLHYYSDDPKERGEVVLPLVATSAFAVGVVVGRARPLSRFQRILQLQDVPSSSITVQGGGPWFRGRVVKVSDGDTFRFYHVPTWFHSTAVPQGLKLSETTWPVRVCTIDTPETAKFGKEGQAFGDQAKDALTDLLQDQTVQVQILTRDQYGRAVAQVKTKGWLPFTYKYADQVMLQAGLAELYRGSGAVYGSKGLEYYEQLEAKAQAAKIGVWSLGDQRESAAEYKARTK